jgi:hypothetical protein
VGIHGGAVGVGFVEVDDAVDGAVIGVEGGAGGEGGVERLVADAAVGVVEVLADGPAAVEVMLEEVADGACGGGVFIDAGFADEGAGVNAAEGMGLEGAAPGEEADGGAHAVLLEVAEEGEAGAVGGAPGEGGGKK